MEIRAVNYLTRAWACALLLLLWAPASVFAAEASCDGPAECCPVDLADHLQAAATVQVGVVMMGVANVNERAGTWDADFYLYEHWKPMPGFTPQSEVVNESERHATQFDTTELRDGVCQRSRRLRSTLRSVYDLRRFPFDHEKLLIEVSDDDFTSRDVVYDELSKPLGFDDGVRDAVPGWKVEGDLAFAHRARVFPWEAGAPAYDYAVFSVTVRRHVAYHLTKYFLPLLVIVVIAFSVFWIGAEDLSSQVTIGVTCVLAAIAFQLAEASSLPEVAYLTLADRVYAVSYVAIGIAVLQTVYANRLVRSGRREAATRADAMAKRVFPVMLVLALAASAVRAFTMGLN